MGRLRRWERGERRFAAFPALASRISSNTVSGALLRHRRGVAEVAATALREPEYREAAKALLADLVNDRDTEVQRAVASVLDHDRTGIAGDVHMLIPLHLRLYEQSSTPGQEATHQECLDLWDSLLAKRVGAAVGLTREVDQV
jgi:hypothetical protein